MKDWIPLITKLVWPAIIALLLIVFHRQVAEIYSIAYERMQAGGSIEIGGFLRLGEKATDTAIKDLSPTNIPIEGIGGAEGVVRKDSRPALAQLQQDLANNPGSAINTLLVTDDIQVYSVPLLKEYVGSLGLTYVVFQEGSAFSGWMTSSLFVAQLPEDGTAAYRELRQMGGIRKESVRPKTSAREVLQQMQELHVDSLPVVDENGKWLFFANRGEILANLITSVLLKDS
jgi:CBS domain-containing protein